MQGERLSPNVFSDSIDILVDEMNSFQPYGVIINDARISIIIYVCCTVAISYYYRR